MTNLIDANDIKTNAELTIEVEKLKKLSVIQTNMIIELMHILSRHIPSTFESINNLGNEMDAAMLRKGLMNKK